MRNFLIATILLTGTLIYLNFLSSVQAVPLLQPLDKFPVKIGEFTMASEQTFSDAVLANLGVDHYIMREYRDESGYPLWLYLGYYEIQSEGEMIHSPKHCMPGSGWNSLETTGVRVDSPEGVVTISRMYLQKGLEKQLAHYWYHGRGRVVSNEYIDRGYMVLDSLLKRRSDEALVRITGSGADFEGDSEKQLVFARDLLMILNEFLPH